MSVESLSRLWLSLFSQLVRISWRKEAGMVAGPAIRAVPVMGGGVRAMGADQDQLVVDLLLGVREALTEAARSPAHGGAVRARPEPVHLFGRALEVLVPRA